MKKITLALATLVVCCLTAPVFAQPYVTITAPGINAYSQVSAPTGIQSQNYMRGCFLITASELAGLTVNSINSFSFLVQSGTGTYNVAGNMTLYMQNTNDTYYSKSSSYGSAISGMSTVYSNGMTVPGNTATSSIVISLSSPFNYAGNGLYIAFDWSATTGAVSSGATYYANTDQNFNNMGAYRSSSSSSSALSSLITSASRPVCRLGGNNTATNELSVISLIAPGEVAEALHTGHTITTFIRNNSIGDLNNINVSLNVTGANNFSDMQIIPTIQAGAVETVTFLPFNPTQAGNNNLSVTIPSDNNNANNQQVWSQAVVCNETANYPPGTAFSSGIGFPNSSGISSSLFNFNTTATLTSVNLGISVDSDTQGKPLYGVLLDINGTILAKTNTITATSNMLGTTQTFSFSPPRVLTANNDYFIGMAHLASAVTPVYYPMAFADADLTGDYRYFFSGINGGTFTISPYGFFSIEPVLAGPELTITQASTIICQGETMTLQANGATTFTWSSSIFNPVDNPNNGTIVVKPASNETYHLVGIDNAGCAGSANAPVAVNACVGIATNAAKSVLKVYPNPAVNGKTTVSGLDGTTTITVYNLLGAAIWVKTITDETAVIDLTSQPAGNYLVKITGAAGDSKTVKIINQN